jgi:ADP-ribosylation factor-like protein 1
MRIHRYVSSSPQSIKEGACPPECASLPLGADKQAIIYVIDSSDASRLPTSRSELLTMLSEDELKSVPVLVFANKQDVEGALSPGDISDKLGLAGQEKGREWSVRGSCATKGEGLEEGLDWYVTPRA